MRQQKDRTISSLSSSNLISHLSNDARHRFKRVSLSGNVDSSPSQWMGFIFQTVTFNKLADSIFGYLSYHLSLQLLMVLHSPSFKCRLMLWLTLYLYLYLTTDYVIGNFFKLDDAMYAASLQRLLI